jgi:hypothetical protein
MRLLSRLFPRHRADMETVSPTLPQPTVIPLQPPNVRRNYAFNIPPGPGAARIEADMMVAARRMRDEMVGSAMLCERRQRGQEILSSWKASRGWE